MYDFCCDCGNTIDSCNCKLEFRSDEEIINEQEEKIKQLESELLQAKEEIELLRMQLNK